LLNIPKPLSGEGFPAGWARVVKRARKEAFGIVVASLGTPGLLITARTHAILNRGGGLGVGVFWGVCLRK